MNPTDNFATRRMIFHHPFPLPTETTSGSRLRLSQMLQAFKTIGYQVEVIAGSTQDRHRAITRLKTLADQGEQFDFLYAESATVPSLWGKGNIYRPLLDLGFFNWIQRQNIPAGLFYRDVYWRFPQAHNTWFLRRYVSTPLYWYDWRIYSRFVNHLFLPSLAMRSALPGNWPVNRTTALPPGSKIFTTKKNKESQLAPLAVFYVGGITPPLYDLKVMFDVVESLNGVQLTVCCREFEWEMVKGHYAPLDDEKIHIVHASGEDLDVYYTAADIFGLWRKPNAYLDFAMPVKLFESLGHATPILTSAGTAASNFVTREDIGWVIKTKDDLGALLVRLRDNRDLVAAKRAQMLQVRDRHTWPVRAQTVADTLMEQPK